MSVDLSRLSAHLGAEQQNAVRRAYRQRAKSATTAFLLCFFLGIFGAHAFYLGRIRQGILRLILSPLIIPGLVWELIDLFHIDHDVYEQNLQVAEQLVAEMALAVPNASVEAEALARLDALVHEREVRTGPLGSPAPEPAGPVFIAAVTEPVSADADTHAASDDDAPMAAAFDAPVAAAPPIWPVAADAADASPYDAYSTPETHAATDVTHGPLPEEAEQPPTVPEEPFQPAPDQEPVWAAWPAPLGTPAGQLAEDVPTLHTAFMDETGGKVGQIDALSRPSGTGDDTDITAAMVAFAAALANEETPTLRRESQAVRSRDFTDDAGYEPAVLPVATYGAFMPVADEWQPVHEDAPPNVDAPPNADSPLAADTLPSAHRRVADPTDRVVAPDAPPLADVGEGSGRPVRVLLPQSASAVPEPSLEAWAIPVAEAAYQPWEAPTGEPATGDAAASFEASGTGAVGHVPSDDDLESSTLVLVADDESYPPGREGEPPATLAEFAGEAPASSIDVPSTGGYESNITEEVGDHEAEGTKRIVKRVRVVRRLMVNGQVVHEATAEQVVDADADTDATARNLQATLGSANPQSLVSRSTQDLPEGTPGPGEGPPATTA